MRKEISISLLALGLVACGGGSSSSDSDSSGSGGNNTLVINKDFASGIRGIEQEPALTSATVSEGDVIALNTNLTGSVLEDSSVSLYFTPTKTEKVAFILSSAAEDLDLEVSTQGLSLESYGFTSNEALVADAIAGQLYTVEVESYVGQGAFQLKLVEANRSSLGLSTNEYVIEAEYTIERACVESGETSTYDSSKNVNKIINWKEGYIMDLSGENKSSFTSINDNSFTATYSKTENDGNYELEQTTNYTTNFETGVLNGTLLSTETETYNSRTEVCTSDIEIAAKVIL
jgi:hypothetical protein